MIPRFQPGQCVITPGAQSQLEYYEISPRELLDRHVQGDWGAVEQEDWQANEDALRQNLRLLSCYKLDHDVKVWIITEWDRSQTTILMPDEY